MSAHVLYPGEYFIFKRDQGRVGWELLYRDDSLSTMDLRYRYQAEKLQPGEALRYERPDGTVMAEVEK
jgi:hypothetical protein